MSVTSPITALSVERVGRGSYVLAGEGGVERASMLLYGNAARAEILTPRGLVVATRQGWRSVIAELAARDTPMRLDPRRSELFGGSSCQWAIRRRWRCYEGTLLSGECGMTLRLTPFSGRRCDIAIRGEWPDREMVALVACYALLVRRQRDQIIMVTAGH